VISEGLMTFSSRKQRKPVCQRIRVLYARVVRHVFKAQLADNTFVWYTSSFSRRQSTFLICQWFDRWKGHYMYTLLSGA
jgi:hypothetical protein